MRKQGVSVLLAVWSGMGMASQILCNGLTESPGTAFACNDWQMTLLLDAVFTQV